MLIRVTTSILLIVGVVAGASAQSLAELARREEERRKTITTKGKVYTNESLRGDNRRATPAVRPAPAASTAVPPSPSGGPAGPQAAAQPPPEPAAPAPARDEATWRKRIQNERDLLQRAQIFAEALQTRINALSADFVNRDDPIQREQISSDRLKALAELDRVKQEIQDHTKAIAAIQEEARKAGVPPGWVR